ncbi:MAG TPA: hypothetical protein VK982_09325 [Bacteroidales bacterium]|nr:hypothetical protein [Bacteroidales bacterium]
MENKMELKMELRTWKNKDTGEVKQFPSYYVEFKGIKINMRPSDRTATQILNMLYGYNVEEKE